MNAVTEAKQRVAAKQDEAKAAAEVVTRLNKELTEAYAALRQAQDNEDATFPGCRMVLVHPYGGKETDKGRVAIIRRTPAGMLIVRQREEEYRFKRSKYSDVYRSTEKTSSFSERRELRDVPEAK